MNKRKIERRAVIDEMNVPEGSLFEAVFRQNPLETVLKLHDELYNVEGYLAIRFPRSVNGGINAPEIDTLRLNMIEFSNKCDSFLDGISRTTKKPSKLEETAQKYLGDLETLENDADFLNSFYPEDNRNLPLDIQRKLGVVNMLGRLVKRNKKKNMAVSPDCLIEVVKLMTNCSNQDAFESREAANTIQENINNFTKSINENLHRAADSGAGEGALVGGLIGYAIGRNQN